MDYCIFAQEITRRNMRVLYPSSDSAAAAAEGIEDAILQSCVP